MKKELIDKILNIFDLEFDATFYHYMVEEKYIKENYKRVKKELEKYIKENYNDKSREV